METRYTATLYTNNQVVKSCVGSDINQLTLSILMHLDDSNSGAYATITDDQRGVVIQRFCKSAIED